MAHAEELLSDEAYAIVPPLATSDRLSTAWLRETGSSRVPIIKEVLASV